MAELLRGQSYLADEGLATIAFLAISLNRPLFLEGAPGVGKTALAYALAAVTETPLLRLQCYEGIDRRQALYDWNFPRQVLHLRASERDAESAADREKLEGSLYDERFLIERPILRALRTRSTLLIDEIDRADDEFEAFLLESLSDYSVSIPELPQPTIRCEPGNEPWVVITSNRTREVHDALKRRCFYHWVGHPDVEREVAIVRQQVPQASGRLVRQAAEVTARLRNANLLKPPGIAETIDWVRALHLLGAEGVDPRTARATLGIVLKNEDDIATVSDEQLTAT